MVNQQADICSVQVAKNIVLAGCGRLTLIDDAPCSSAPTSNFLVPASAEPTARWDTVPADTWIGRDGLLSYLHQMHSAALHTRMLIPHELREDQHWVRPGIYPGTP